MNEGTLSSFTWTCMICGKERPDADISVYKRRMEVTAGFLTEVNIRYCNDKYMCLDWAKKAPTMKDLKAAK